MGNQELILKILTFLKPYRLRLLTAIMALLIVVSSLLSLGYVVKDYIDQSFGKNLQSNSALYSIIFLTLVFGFGSFLRSLIINTTAEIAGNDIKKIAFKKLSSLNLETIDKYSYSDLSSRVCNDSDFITKVIIDSTSFFIRNILMCVGSIILMFSTSPQLSFFALIVIIILAATANILGKKTRILAKTSEQSKSLISGFVFESLSNIKTIIAFGKQDLLNSHFDNLNSHTLSLNLKRLKARSIFFGIVITSILLTLVSLIAYGSYLISINDITSGTLASFIYHSFLMATSFGGLIEMLSEMQKNLANCERIFELIEIKEPNNFEDLKIIDLSNASNVEFKNIEFTYKTHNNSTSQKKIYNLTIPLGKFTTIIGPSGSGKTTLLSILLGLYHFDKGEVIIGKQTFNSLYPKAWAGKIAYVPQDNILFSGTIWENLTFFSHDNINFTKEEVLSLISELGLADYINSLPNKLAHNLGNLASQISGGQKQRIAIARAILARPEILILDEATSQLDAETENIVLATINKYMKGKTIICVAHRESSMKIADQIIKL